MEKHVSQCRAILGHLKLHGTITPLEAAKKFNCLRLSGRIWELRRRGHRITGQLIKRNGKHFSEYSLQS